MQKNEFVAATSEQVIDRLCKRLEAIRVARNISQSELAREAGVSRSTLTRLADGQAISLDSFVRVMLALGLSDQLAALLPDPDVRPVERVRGRGKERKRASKKRVTTGDWTWGDGRGG